MISPIKKIDTVTGKKSKFVKKAEDVLERTYINKDKTLIDTLIKQPEKRTISSINDLYDKLWNDEANQAIQLLKKWKLKVLNQYGVEHTFSEWDVKKHTKWSQWYVEWRSYFSNPDGSNMSLNDVYDLQIKGMSKIDKETFDIDMAGGAYKEIDMQRIIGFNTKQNKYSTVLCFVRDANLQVHAYPCND